jgi:hypothetical protein
VVRDDSTPNSGGDNTPDPGGDTPEPGDAMAALEQLAQLQAGNLDDATAAQLRQEIRDNPELARQFAALDQVRRYLAGLDSTPAPEAPAEVTARIGAALRAAHPDTPGHRVPGSGRRTHASGDPMRWRQVAALAGAGALAVALVVGTVMVLNDSEQPPTPTTGPTAEYLKTPRHAGMPLADQKIIGLLDRPLNLGPLADPSRTASCLQGLGYSTGTPVLGATTFDTDGSPQVLLLLPATDPRSLMALLVAGNCSAADAGLLADALLARP